MVNHVEFDEISQVDVFDNQEDNIKLSNDIISQKWQSYYQTKIDGFDPIEVKKLSIYLNPIPQQKKVAIQFRYPKFDKPKNFGKIREVTIERIEEIKSLQKENESMVLETTRKVEELIELLNEESYSEFYNALHPKAREESSYDQFLVFIDQVKEAGFKKENRVYLNKALSSINDSTSEFTEFIQYRYRQKNLPKKIEVFNFEYSDGEMAFVGYRVYQERSL